MKEHNMGSPKLHSLETDTTKSFTNPLLCISTRPLSSHSEGEELLEHVEDVGIQVLREEESFQRRAVLLHLLVMLKE